MGMCLDFRQLESRVRRRLIPQHPLVRKLDFLWVAQRVNFTNCPEIITGRPGVLRQQTNQTELFTPNLVTTRRVGRSMLAVLNGASPPHGNNVITYESCADKFTANESNAPCHFSVAILAKPNDTSTGPNHAFGQSRSGTSHKWWIGHGTPSNSWGFYTNEVSGSGSQGGGEINSATDFQRGVWSMVVAVLDGAYARLYVNGREVTNQQHNRYLENNAFAPTVFGDWHNGASDLADGYLGALAMAAYWNRALGARDVKQLSMRPWDLLRRARQPDLYKIPVVAASQSNWFMVV